MTLVDADDLAVAMMARRFHHLQRSPVAPATVPESFAEDDDCTEDFVASSKQFDDTSTHPLSAALRVALVAILDRTKLCDPIHRSNGKPADVLASLC